MKAFKIVGQWLLLQMHSGLQEKNSDRDQMVKWRFIGKKCACVQPYIATSVDCVLEKFC